MIRLVARVLIALLIISEPSNAFAYLKLGTPINGQVVDVYWHQQPIQYFVTDRDVPGVTASALRDAVGRAVNTWQSAPNASVRFEFQGMTSAAPVNSDARTTIGFADRPDLDRVLGSTSFLIDSVSGTIVEADIFLNSKFDWSVAPQGEPGRVDVESVALHELGHLLGLSHSALGETELMSNGGRRVVASGSVMFPIAMTAGAIAERALQADDMAGISDLYPKPDLDSETGAIAGKVTRGGRGVIGAHVVAFNPSTGALVGTFSLNASGDFVIGRLQQGLYILRVEPLDDADPESFFSVPIDSDFRVTYFSRQVVVPKGGSPPPVNIAVDPK